MRGTSIILLILLPVVAPAAGYVAGSFLARANDTVRLAERVWLEESQHFAERTDESTAFRETGRPVTELYAEAARVERRFVVGGALLGLWCGLVIALKLFSLVRPDPREVFDIDHAQCVCCARCFLSCPRERVRRKALADAVKET